MPSSAAIVKNAVQERRLRSEAGSASLKVLAAGGGWRIADIACAADKGDRKFEETHAFASIALVTAGAFSYHCARGKADLCAGAILLGNAGASFCCGHEHGAGDRCIAFQMTPPALEAICSLSGDGARPHFPSSAIPASKSSGDIIAMAELFASGDADIDPAGLLMQVVARVLPNAGAHTKPVSHAKARRAIEVARVVEDDPAEGWTLALMAKLADMNEFVFLRCFKQVCGLAPYAFVRQARLREAARLLAQSDFTVARVAAESGFGDLSAFNQAFKRTFGRQPGQFRSRFRRLRESR